ncbi:MAG TPA: hypothetical protein DEP35_16215 [Deltaproteobacteria bacterium]|jgi:hypothetical protein|nr:hypothetical protein [Deltaproteobacteria bacterium]
MLLLRITRKYSRLLATFFAFAGTSLFLHPALATPSACDAVAGNLVANCGFEGGVYSSTIGGFTNTSVPNGWTPNQAYDQTGFNHVVTTPVNSGGFALQIGNFDTEPAPTLSQILTDVATASYSGSIFVNYGGFTTPDSGAFFDLQINGVTVLALNDTTPNSYVQYNFSFTGTGSDTLTLTGNTNLSEWFVDDVVVTAVPEPATGLLVMGGVLGLAASRRRAGVSA